MNWDLGTLLNGLFGAGGLAVIVLKLIELYSNRGKSRAETGVLKSEASENITEAAQVAANVLLQALTFKQAETKEYQDRVKALEGKQEENEKLVRELTDHKEERGKQITELQEQNEALQSGMAALNEQIAKDTKETKSLRDEVENLRRQVAAGKQERDELLQKYNGLKAYTEKLVKKLKEEYGIDPPPVNGDPPDSISKWKWDDKK